MTLLLEKLSYVTDTIKYICENNLISINVGIGVTFLALIILTAHFSIAATKFLCPLVSLLIFLSLIVVSHNHNIQDLRNNFIGCIIGHLWTMLLFVG